MERMPESGICPADVTASFAIAAAPPFHLEATVRALQRRPTNRVNLWDDGRYWRVLPTDEGLRLVAVENRGSIDAPAMRLQHDRSARFEAACKRAEAADIVAHLAS
jgi:hypothetical protein